MGNNQFAFNRYNDQYAAILFDEFAAYCRNDIQPYFSGVGVGMAKSDFLKKIKAFVDKQYRPPIVVNNHDVPIGFYHIKYCRANRYHELMLHLWNDKDLAEPIFKEIIDQALSKERPADSLLVEIPGYAHELKQAADNLMDLSGVIPNYLRHGDKLFHKYSYVITSSNWHADK